MAALPLRADSVRFNPPALTDRAAIAALIEELIEELIALLDALDGDPDCEDGDEDCCPAFDDRGGLSLAGFDPFAAPGEPEDAEDCDPAEDDWLALPGALHGALQDDRGRGWNCAYAAADALAYAPMFAHRGPGGAA